MTQHISARLAWHQDGWNGRICRFPQLNGYCVGSHSYPGELIRELRNLDWECQPEVAGHACPRTGTAEKLPACMYSINAFGSKPIRAFAHPPTWFNDDSQTKYWDMPPATVCVWPYEEMYNDSAKTAAGRFDYAQRLVNAKALFQAFTNDRSLVVYYSNYSNPFSEEDNKRYVIVGLSRLKQLGEVMYYDGVSKENKEKLAGGFVWQMPITSHYPDEGLRIPYHLYADQPEILNRLVLFPENDRVCKYAMRSVSDDDLLELVERLLDVVNTLIEIKDTSDNWTLRQTWLQSLIAELWQSRGAWPGLPAVLNVLGFEAAIQFVKRKTAMGLEKEAYTAVFSFLNEKSEIEELLLSPTEIKKIRRQWQLRTEVERQLLAEVLPRFDLQQEQIESILSSERTEHGIESSLKDIIDNPYLLTEQYVGDGPDDRISFGKIDHGTLPSPELGVEAIADTDDPRRLRAVCVERLRREAKHTFMSLSLLLHDINHKLSFLPEWKRHQFTDRYFEVDWEELSGALTMVEKEGTLYVYLKRVYEDERMIEKQVRALAKRPDVSFRSPVTEQTWKTLLYDEGSPLTSIRTEYEQAISGQGKVCAQIFTKPVCVVSGSAGTGKTTIVKALIQAVEKAHGVGTAFQLLAPTGKAADRLREKTGKPAQTIHSFLAQHGWLNPNMTFKRSGGKREDAISTYIIDESSMIDLELAAALFRSIHWEHVQRLIFVGDPNQLPPIGQGRMFADVIEWLDRSVPEQVGKLDINLRQMENRVQKKGTGILDVAELYIRTAIQPDEQRACDKMKAETLIRKLQEGGEVDQDLRILYWQTTEELPTLLMNTIIADMEADSGEQYDAERPSKLLNIAGQDENGSQRADYQQVISPYRGEPFGIEALNVALQDHFNRRNVQHKGTLAGVTLFDKVIQTVNRPKSRPYYAYNCKTKQKEKLEVYNGEIGFVKPHSYDAKYWKAPFFHLKHFQVVFSRKKEYFIEFCSPGEVENNLELAYAISVHKAQGSEFQRVYFVLPKSKKTLLCKELLYTGITRAQKHLTILVEEDVSPLISLRRPERSHLSLINSSLFELMPIPEELLLLNSWHEEGKIHRTLANHLVRSKSEVIISNLLFDRDIPFLYEAPLFASDGTFYLPDFTITWQGEKWFWEHLGMMDNPSYRNHQETKRKWYEQHFPGQLLTTEESGNLSQEAAELIQKYFS